MAIQHGTLTYNTTPGQSSLRNNGNEWVLQISQRAGTTSATPDAVSNQGLSFKGRSPFSAEEQFVYSTTQSNWAKLK